MWYGTLGAVVIVKVPELIAIYYVYWIDCIFIMYMKWAGTQ